jgi:prophage regulatory protein
MSGEKLLTVAETMERTGLSRQTIHRLRNDDLFPTPRQITPGRIGYLESEITAWIEGRGKVGGNG